MARFTKHSLIRSHAGRYVARNTAMWLWAIHRVVLLRIVAGTVANQCVASAISEENAIERVLVPTQDASIPKSIALESVT